MPQLPFLVATLMAFSSSFQVENSLSRRIPGVPQTVECPYQQKILKLQDRQLYFVNQTGAASAQRAKGFFEKCLKLKSTFANLPLLFFFLFCLSLPLSCSMAVSPWRPSFASAAWSVTLSFYCWYHSGHVLVKIMQDPMSRSRILKKGIDGMVHHYI